MGLIGAADFRKSWVRTGPLIRIAARRNGMRRRPSRNCLLRSCAEAESRPEGRATRGRSEAESLARRRAQRQHRIRDGRREHVRLNAWPHCGSIAVHREAQFSRKPSCLTAHIRSTRAALVRPDERDLQTATTTLGSHGVSDPVRAAAGRSLTPAAGSLTPWSLL